MIEALIFAAVVGSVLVLAQAGKKKTGTVKGRGASKARQPDRIREEAESFDVEIRVSYGGAAPLNGRPTRSADCWVPAGQTKMVGNRRVAGGLLYVGKNLPAPGSSTSVDACLIDPDLPRNDAHPDPTGQGMNYWPSYSGIPAASRSAYLDWLEGGRQDPEAYIGYVFLYFYGLERRALHDAPEERAAEAELEVILAEVERLLEIYGNNGSFRNYAGNFASLLRHQLQAEGLSDSFDPYRQSYEVPLDIRTAVGRLALESKPLPTGLALAWATSDPNIRLRTAARRCAREFEALFCARYDKSFGDGLALPICKRQVVAEYRPASSSFAGVITHSTGVPDVTALVGPRRKLEALVEEVTADLDPYSRKLGRDPSEEDANSAAVLLPPELISSHAPKSISSVLTRLRESVASESPCLVDSGEALGIWLSEGSPKLSKKDSVAAANLLSHVGVGIEPDVRFGGTRVSVGEQVAIFALGPDDPEAPSAAYAAASLLLHLSAQVAAADGEISMEEERQLEKHVSKALHLGDGERRRLVAHIKWLLANPPGMAGVKMRVEALGREQREAVAGFLVGVAAADGKIDPAEVKTLTKLFKALGLDPARVHTELHARHTTPGPAQGPVTVRTASPARQGEAIPRPPAPADDPAPAPAETVLDQASIERKLQESAAVSKLLGSIFAEDDPNPPVLTGSATNSEGLVIDEAHTEILRALAKNAVLPREDYDALAEQHGLMPDGALEALNDLAWDSCDGPLVEDLGDVLEIDLETCKTLLER